eukprot:g5466.t1
MGTVRSCFGYCLRCPGKRKKDKVSEDDPSVPLQNQTDVHQDEWEEFGEDWDDLEEGHVPTGTTHRTGSDADHPHHAHHALNASALHAALVTPVAPPAQPAAAPAVPAADRSVTFSGYSVPRAVTPPTAYPPGPSPTGSAGPTVLNTTTAGSAGAATRFVATADPGVSISPRRPVATTAVGEAEEEEEDLFSSMGLSVGAHSLQAVKRVKVAPSVLSPLDQDNNQDHTPPRYSGRFAVDKLMTTRAHRGGRSPHNMEDLDLDLDLGEEDEADVGKAGRTGRTDQSKNKQKNKNKKALLIQSAPAETEGGWPGDTTEGSAANADDDFDLGHI